MTLKNMWAYLPNAVHISRIVESVKSHRLHWESPMTDSVHEARLVSSYAIKEARLAHLKSFRIDAWNSIHIKTCDSLPAQYAVMSLIAWDDSASYLEMNSDELRVWSMISERPAAALILPAVIAFEEIQREEIQRSIL